jgi:hypothetical protein
MQTDVFLKKKTRNLFYWGCFLIIFFTESIYYLLQQLHCAIFCLFIGIFSSYTPSTSLGRVYRAVKKIMNYEGH